MSNSLDHVFDRLESGSARDLLLTRGFYRSSPEPAHRSALFERGDRLELIADLWIEEEERPRVRNHIASRGSLRTGGWDAMARTTWAYAWTHDERPFSLWHREGRRWKQTEEGALVNLEDHRRYEPDDIEAVEAYVGSEWIERGVRLILVNDTTINVCKTEVGYVMRFLNFLSFYDIGDLIIETRWSRQLARALADAVHAEMIDST